MEQPTDAEYQAFLDTFVGLSWRPPHEMHGFIAPPWMAAEADAFCASFPRMKTDDMRSISRMVGGGVERPPSEFDNPNVDLRNAIMAWYRVRWMKWLDEAIEAKGLPATDDDLRMAGFIFFDVACSLR